MSQATHGARFVVYCSAQSTAHTLTRNARLMSSIAVHQPDDLRHHRRLRTPSGLPREVTRLKQNCAITAWTVVSLTSRTVLRRAVHSPRNFTLLGEAQPCCGAVVVSESQTHNPSSRTTRRSKHLPELRRARKSIRTSIRPSGEVRSRERVRQYFRRLKEGNAHRYTPKLARGNGYQ